MFTINELQKKIEHLKQKLEYRIAKGDCDLIDQRIVSISQQLDILLNQYNKLTFLSQIKNDN